jgi:hypothetical protein
MAFKKAYSIQLRDHRSGELIQASGGKVYVAQTGSPAKETLYDMDGAALANPVALSNGRMSFQVDADVNSVDLYIMAPGGQFVTYPGVAPGGPNEINIDTGQRHQVAVIPFSIDDTMAATETDTGFDMPLHAAVQPNPMVRVTAVDATETIDIGLLSSETAGDADGFAAGVSVATAGLAKATIANGANTLGALFEVQDSANAGDLTHEQHVVTGSNATSITYTLSAGSDTAEGFLVLPYLLTA